MSGQQTIPDVTNGQVQVPVTIDFTQIPDNLLTPGAYMEVTTSLSSQGLMPYPAKVLLMAPKVAAGTLAPLTPLSIYGAAQGIAAFGQGSYGAHMVETWYANNQWTPLDVMVLPDPSGATAQTAEVTIGLAGTATESGTLAVYVSGTAVPVPVTAGVDTAATICAALVAAINAAPDCLASAAVNGTTPSIADLTCKTLGVVSGGFNVETDLYPSDQPVAGVTVTVALTAGSGLHDLAAAFAAVATSPYTMMMYPGDLTAHLTEAATETERRFNAMAGLDCLFFASADLSLSALISSATGVNGRFVYFGGNAYYPPGSWRITAALCAQAAAALAQDPARQLRGLALLGLPGPPVGIQSAFDVAERNTLLAAGVSTFTVDASGTFRIDRIVSTETTDSAGIPTTAWQDIMTAATAIRIRYDWINYCNATYPRNKLAPDGSTAAAYDPTVVTPRRLSSSWAARCQVYEQNGWIVNGAATAAASVFEIDANNPNRVNSRQQVQIIGNLITLAGQINFAAAA